MLRNKFTWAAGMERNQRVVVAAAAAQQLKLHLTACHLAVDSLNEPMSVGLSPHCVPAHICDRIPQVPTVIPRALSATPACICPVTIPGR
jgi:hypothetical protein